MLDRLDPAGRRLLDEGEGCLSVPGAVMDVPRPDRAVVRGALRQVADRREEVFARRAAKATA